MAVAYESVSTTSWGTVTDGNSLTITKPTGLAVGDTLVAHLSAVRTGAPNADGWATPSGWTLLLNTDSSGNLNSSAGMYVFYKVADSADVAASNFSFVKSGNNSTRVIGSLYRISGASAVTGTIATTDSDSTPTFTNTITPSANSLLLFLTTVSEPSPVSGSVSGYAITTDNPSWTEVYDSTSLVTDGGLHGGAYASRSQATATGDSSCTYVTIFQNSIGAIVALAPIVSVTFSIDAPGILTLQQGGEPTFTLDNIFTLDSAGIITLSTPEPSIETEQNAEWTPDSKPSTAWTND